LQTDYFLPAVPAAFLQTDKSGPALRRVLLFNIIMLYRIKFISDEADGFLREIKIDSDATFLDLNKVILQSCGYSDDQMTSFFVCDDEWERREQITREDMGAGDVDEDIYVMADTPLSDFIEDEGQKLEFVFDPFAERTFFLNVKELIPGSHLDVPEIVRAVGEPPVQIQEMDFAPAAGGAKAAGSTLGPEDLDEMYGSESFDSEDFDPEGFEISDGDPYRD